VSRFSPRQLRSGYPATAWTIEVQIAHNIRQLTKPCQRCDFWRRRPGRRLISARRILGERLLSDVKTTLESRRTESTLKRRATIFLFSRFNDREFFSAKADRTKSASGANGSKDPVQVSCYVSLLVVIRSCGEWLHAVSSHGPDSDEVAFLHRPHALDVECNKRLSLVGGGHEFNLRGRTPVQRPPRSPLRRPCFDRSRSRTTVSRSLYVMWSSPGKQSWHCGTSHQTL
jgi:hypothetical protein